MNWSVLRERKRLLSSLGYTGLVALVAALGYLTLKIVESPRSEGPEPLSDPAALIEFEGFSARPERVGTEWQLRITLRLRTATTRPLDCQLFLVARGEQAEQKFVGAWPTLTPSGPFSSAGYFRGGSVSSGAPLTLTPSWQKVSGSIPMPNGPTTFHTVTVYVFGNKGEVLLARPFSISH